MSRPLSGVARVAVRTARRLDHAIGRLTARRQVLVDARTPMNLVVMGPVWRRLLRDPRVAVTVTGEQLAGLAAALAESERPLLHEPAAVTWRRFDLAMTADAWNETPLQRCRQRLNFFHGVAGKYDLDDPARLAGTHFGRFDRVAFINQDRLQRYVTAGVIRPDQAALVGFPKLDALVNGAWNAGTVRRSLGLDPSRPTVLYAPTFSTANSLHTWGEPLLDALLGAGNLIIKLHDRSMTPDPKYTGGVDWPSRLARYAADPRVAFARHADIAPLLAAADVMVTDHSTVGFEFALLDRPLVIADAPGLKSAARIEAGKWTLLRSMGEVARTPAELTAAVLSALVWPQRHSSARRAAHALFAHAGEATDRALRVVYDLIDLEAPLLAPAVGERLADDALSASAVSAPR